MSAIFKQKLNNSISTRYMFNDLKIDDIAKDLSISERQLQRKAKTILNMSPVAYLRKYRLCRSKELLSQEISIERAGLKVGFKSHSYFSRCFKQEFGCTATEYLLNPVRVK